MYTNFMSSHVFVDQDVGMFIDTRTDNEKGR